VVGVVDDVNLVDVGFFDVLELKASVEDNSHLFGLADGGFDVLFGVFPQTFFIICFCLYSFKIDAFFVNSSLKVSLSCLWYVVSLREELNLLMPSTLMTRTLLETETRALKCCYA